MPKMIKLSDTHYIVVDDSEIEDENFYYNNREGKVNRQEPNQQLTIEDLQGGQIRYCFKITHSTQPLEQGYGCEVKDGKMLRNVGKEPCYALIKPLSLLEVEEAIYGYSIEKMAIEAADKNSKGTSDHWMGVRTGYHLGFNAHKELVKDKLLITDKDLLDFLYFARTHSQYSDGAIVKEFTNRFLKEQTEWDVEIVDGKIKLL